MKKKTPITRVISARTARTHFGDVVHRPGEHGERLIVERRGEPQVMILSLENHGQNAVKPSRWLTPLHRFANRRGLDTMTMTGIDRETRRLRKKLSRSSKR